MYKPQEIIIILRYIGCLIFENIPEVTIVSIESEVLCASIWYLWQNICNIIPEMAMILPIIIKYIDE